MAIGRTNANLNFKKLIINSEDYYSESAITYSYWGLIYTPDSEGGPIYQKSIESFNTTKRLDDSGKVTIFDDKVFSLETGRKYYIKISKYKGAISSSNLIKTIEKEIFLEDDMTISINFYGRTYPDISSTGIIYGPYKDDLETLITNIDEEPDWNIVIKDSQTLTFNRFYDDNKYFEAILVGGGGAGGNGVNKTLGDITYCNGGGGGQAGGITYVDGEFSASIEYPIIIGAGGVKADGGDTGAFGWAAVGGQKGNNGVTADVDDLTGGGDGILGQNRGDYHDYQGGSGSGCSLLHYEYVYDTDGYTDVNGEFHESNLHNWIDNDTRDPGIQLFNSGKYVAQGGGGGDGYNGGDPAGIKWGWLCCPGGEERWIEGTSKSCWGLSDETHFGWGRSHCGESYSVTTYSADAEANTGGGGGGGDHIITTGGNGGSGVVIIRNART